MKNYFIIHGTFGHNKENWFPWLEEELKKQGKVVYNFNYPTPDGQSFAGWSAVLDKVKSEINEETTFICHSIAPIFVVKYCITNNIKIKKLISVSGANNFKVGVAEFDDINEDMFIDDVSKFKDLCKERVCYYAKNDPYVKPQYLQSFAKSIGAKEIVYDNAGHFNEKAGFTKFNDILFEL
ncbi:MAG: alpha/beta hydrolase [Clostridia bacterium]|nr:alpha/beta hydrolase [Clostridia bacterium]